MTTPTLVEYLSVLRRRLGIVLGFVILVPVAAIVATSLQTPQYAASAQVLLSRQDLAAALTGANTSPDWDNPDRYLNTQALLAQLPQVAARALKLARVRDRLPADLLAATDVAPVQNADLLSFRVADTNRPTAALLATSYARAFTAFRRELDVETISSALSEVRRTRARQTPGSSLYASLRNKEQQLSTIAALQTPASLLARPATTAVQTRPRWKTNVAAAVVFGLLLGIGFAFLIEALDRRVHRVEDIGGRLGLPLLGRVPGPPASVAESGGLIMVKERLGPYAEVFRMLGATFEIAVRSALGTPSTGRIILATSAVEREGKSTTIGNLGVALAQAGRRVVLVDLDLRAPYLHALFNVSEKPGISDVLHKAVPLERALRPVALFQGVGGVPLTTPPEASTGSLHVLPSGSVVLNTSEFIGGNALSSLLTALASDADYVLVDTAPLLRVGDTVGLFKSVDALMLVTRLGVLDGDMLDELERILAMSEALHLGYAVTGLRVEDIFQSSYYSYGRERQAAEERAREVSSSLRVTPIDAARSGGRWRNP